MRAAPPAAARGAPRDAALMASDAARRADALAQAKMMSALALCDAARAMRHSAAAADEVTLSMMPTRRMMLTAMPPPVAPPRQRRKMPAITLFSCATAPRRVTVSPAASTDCPPGRCRQPSPDFAEAAARRCTAQDGSAPLSRRLIVSMPLPARLRQPLRQPPPTRVRLMMSFTLFTAMKTRLP